MAKMSCLGYYTGILIGNLTYTLEETDNCADEDSKLANTPDLTAARDDQIFEKMEVCDVESALGEEPHAEADDTLSPDGQQQDFAETEDHSVASAKVAATDEVNEKSVGLTRDSLFFDVQGNATYTLEETDQCIDKENEDNKLTHTPDLSTARDDQMFEKMAPCDVEGASGEEPHADRGSEADDTLSHDGQQHDFSEPDDHSVATAKVSTTDEANDVPDEISKPRTCLD
ncbi:unnamed protein product [Dibothriocephalus latus]|uniref:Uncharacterized protein n=1 Tax=Dibothriocephalus latus TaxID=60516 RepID=A0A3P7NNY1_DIBLA|nr:unnamed protein product [Dibothriocephalus latus]